MRFRFLVVAFFAAQSVVAQTPTIPIRELTPAEAKTAQTFGIVSGLRELPGGKVLINDGLKRRLLMFASDLRAVTVLADTNAGTATQYPRMLGVSLIPYAGDTTMFMDYESRSFILIEPDGKIGRTMAPPKPQDFSNVTSSQGLDANGRLIYRGANARNPFLMNAPPTPGAAPPPPAPPDSAPIVRADFDTRSVDTLARVRTPTFRMPVIVRDASGKTQSATSVLMPVAEPLDDWALTSDGVLAIVRGHDYHIDWFDATGAKSSSPKLPFDWRRLTDEDKQFKLDSARRIMDSVQAAGGRGGFMTSSRAGVTDTIMMTYAFPPLSEIPYYIAPIRMGAVKADRDGNVWILPTTSLQARGGLLYDVVNQKNGLVERVQLPSGRTLAGFGRDGVVYLAGGDRAAGFYIERTRIIRRATLQ